MKKDWLIVIFFILAISNLYMGDENKADFYLRTLAGPGEKCLALEWLGLLKDTRAIPYILKILKTKDELHDNKGRAIEYLVRIGYRDGIIPIVESILYNENIYWGSECIDALKKIDPQWMDRSDVKAFIPRYISGIKRSLKNMEKDPYEYPCSSFSALVKFINVTDPQKAIPIDIEVIKNCGKVEPETLKFVSDNLSNNNISNKDVQEAHTTLINKIFCLDRPIRDLEIYRQILDKLYPGWEKTSLFEENTRLTLNKIKNSSIGINDIYTMKLLNPSALVPLLGKIISDREEDDDLKTYAILVLSEISPQENFDLFIPGLTDKNQGIRMACIKGIGASRNPKAIPYLIDALKIQDKDVQEAASIAIGRINAREAIAPLLNLLKNQKNSHLVTLIMSALSSIKPNPPANEMLQVLFNNNQTLDWTERGMIYRILSKVNDPLILNHLIIVYPRLSIKDKSYILKNLIDRKDIRLLPIFKNELKSPDIRIRALAEYGIFNLSH